jgi:hypothetical protein
MLPMREEVAPIRVRVPSAPVAGAVEEALPKPAEKAERAKKGELAKKADRAEPANARPLRDRQPAPTAEKREFADEMRRPAAQDSRSGKQLNAISGEPSAAPLNAEAAHRKSSAPASEPRGAAQGAPSIEREEKRSVVEARNDARAGAKEPAPQHAQRSPVGALQSIPATVPPAGAATAGQFVPPRTADQLEDEASAARRRGEYARAGSLYRDASALRKASEPARAAWNLAHAVECLAAGGLIAEAIATRKELLGSFPDQSGPRAAADSALRSVPLPRDEEKPAPAR